MNSQKDFILKKEYYCYFYTRWDGLRQYSPHTGFADPVNK